jgi:hypothetical protein
VATRNYNVNRELVSTQDSKEPTNNRYFVNNASGEAITVVRGNFATQAAIDNAVNSAFTQTTNTVKAHFFYFANGQAIGSVGQLLGENPFSSSAVAHFDVNYTSAVQQTGPTSVAEVVAREGETLRMIAQRSFGDANLWYLIADENGLSDPDAAIPAGRILRMPTTVVSLSNTSNSFKPFNPADAIGNTVPTQAPVPMPNAGGCGMIGTIIVLIVLIIVTVLSAGTAAGATGPTGAALVGGMSTTSAWTAGMAALSGNLAAGTAASVAASAAGAIVGGVVSQGVGIALGVQKDFDWKGIALGAISAGIGAGVGSLARGAGAIGTFAKANPKVFASLGAVAGNLAGQGIGVAIGLQPAFDWRSVAVSAITAPLGKAIGGSTGGGQLENFVTDLGMSGVGVGIRAALGEKIDGRRALADAFGNAIGNAIVGALTSNSSIGGVEDNADSPSMAQTAADSDVIAPVASGGAVADSGDALEEVVVTGYRSDHDGFRPTLSNALYYPGINDGYFRRTGSEGTHYYSVQLAGSAFLGAPAAGNFNLDRLNHIVAYSQWPDENRFTDAKANGILIGEEMLFNHPNDEFDIGFEPLETNTSRNGRILQKAIHGLNGHAVRENLSFAQFLIEKYWFDDAVVGLAMHLTGDSVHHVLLNGNDNPSWEQLMDLETYPEFYGHAAEMHAPDLMNLQYPNQALFGARAFTESFQRIPGLSDLTQIGDAGPIGQVIALQFGFALDRATDLQHGFAGNEAFENAWRQAVPNFLPDGVWDLQPEHHDIPDPADIRGGTDPYSYRITYDTTFAETDSFLKGVVDTRSFVDRGIAAVKIVAEEYMKRYHPNDRPLIWTVSPYNKRGGVR